MQYAGFRYSYFLILFFLCASSAQAVDPNIPNDVPSAETLGEGAYQPGGVGIVESMILSNSNSLFDDDDEYGIDEDGKPFFNHVMRPCRIENGGNECMLEGKPCQFNLLGEGGAEPDFGVCRIVTGSYSFEGMMVAGTHCVCDTGDWTEIWKTQQSSGPTLKTTSAPPPPVAMSCVPDTVDKTLPTFSQTYEAIMPLSNLKSILGDLAVLDHVKLMSEADDADVELDEQEENYAYATGVSDIVDEAASDSNSSEQAPDAADVAAAANEILAELKDLNHSSTTDPSLSAICDQEKQNISDASNSEGLVCEDKDCVPGPVDSVPEPTCSYTFVGDPDTKTATYDGKEQEVVVVVVTLDVKTDPGTITFPCKIK